MINKLQDTLQIPVENAVLTGDIVLPNGYDTLVIFSHTDGGSNLSPRNGFVAHILNEHGIGTLLIGLLTEGEAQNHKMRSDIPFLTLRLMQVTRHMLDFPWMKTYNVGFLGAGTGAASALCVAAHMLVIHAVVSRGGRPDLAGDSLGKVQASTLLIVGGLDNIGLEYNRVAFEDLKCKNKQLKIIPAAGPLFEEDGTLHKMAELAADWFKLYLQPEATAGKNLTHV